MVAKSVTHAHSIYLITINFVIFCDNAVHLYMESHQTLPSPRMIFKVICTGVGWVLLARLCLGLVSCTKHIYCKLYVNSE